MKTITTPTGTARYCWLNNPDTRFDEGGFGAYRCELILEEDDWNKLKKEITPLYDAAYKDEMMRQGKKKRKHTYPSLLTYRLKGAQLPLRTAFKNTNTPK